MNVCWRYLYFVDSIWWLPCARSTAPHAGSSPLVLHRFATVNLVEFLRKRKSVFVLSLNVDSFFCCCASAFFKMAQHTSGKKHAIVAASKRGRGRSRTKDVAPKSDSQPAAVKAQNADESTKSSSGAASSTKRRQETNMQARKRKKTTE